MSTKRYRSIACAIALATSFAIVPGGPAYAEDLGEAATASSEDIQGNDTTQTPADNAAASAVAKPAAEAAVSTGTEPAEKTTAEPAPVAAADANADQKKMAPPPDPKLDSWNASRPGEKEISDMLAGYAGQTIVSINLEGVGNKTQATATAAVTSHPGDKLTIEGINKDREAIYDTGYFYDIYPSFEILPEGIAITYHVLENPILQSVEITGNTVEKTEELNKLITVKTGEIVDSKLLHENIKAIEGQYRKDGYILAKINDINIGRDGRLIIKINEGVLEGYSVKGNTKTKDRVIMREMRMKKGEPFNAKKARRSMQRVYNLGFFEDVNMKLNPGVEPNAIVLEIDVKEKRTGNFMVGAGYSSQDGAVGMVGIGDSNFRGTGDSVNLTYEFSGDQSDAHGYTFSYHRPWIDSKETAGTFRIYNRTYEYNDYDTSGNLIEDYMRKYSGAEITLSRPVSEYSTNFITLRNRKDQYVRYESGKDRSGSAYEQWRHDNFGTTRSITLEHVTDTRDNIYNPTSGTRVSLTAETAGFGGDFKYQKYTIEDQRYHKVGHAQVLALRATYGHGNGSIPEMAQYKVGGQDSLRGYRDDQFRGNSMYLGTIEYRFPIISKVQGALFTDFGAAWNSGWAPEGTHSSIGVGLQLQTPLGPIRVDYGHGSQGNRLHFSVGGTF